MIEREHEQDDGTAAAAFVAHLERRLSRSRADAERLVRQYDHEQRGDQGVPEADAADDVDTAEADEVPGPSPLPNPPHLPFAVDEVGEWLGLVGRLARGERDRWDPA
jgi:hypothetical protein